MTDNEIKKALECCGRIKGQDCDTCPLTELQLSECTAKVATESLYLINSQKAEIERLQQKYELSEAEREANVKGFTESIAIVKSEAIKEYKEKVKQILLSKGMYIVAAKNALNEAEKEMTEEEGK